MVEDLDTTSLAAGDDSLRIGTSAGAICYSHMRDDDRLAQNLSRSAQIMWESLRSSWILCAIWSNGTTVWRSPEGDRTAFVSVEESIQIHEFS